MRGFIQECELEDGVLRIEASEAWGATDFRHLLEGHYEDMKVYYIVEEEGCEVYATNDVEGKSSYRFAVDSCVEGEDEFEYFKTEAEALQYIAGRLNRNFISVEEIKEWNEEHELRTTINQSSRIRNCSIKGNGEVNRLSTKTSENEIY